MESAEIRALESVAIRFAGDSGDGMQLTGDRFTQETARLGNTLSTQPDFPAEIRAPAGTVAGVSAYQIHFGSSEVYTPGDKLDALVAMNPAALKKNLGDLKPNGIIICNSDNFNERNLKLAEYRANPLDDESLKHSYTLVPVAITSMTEETLKDSGLPRASVARCANFFAFGVVCWLFSRGVDETVSWIEKKFAKKPELAAANKAALRSGMAYAEACETFPSQYQIPAAKLKPGLYRNVTGHQGVVYGLLAASELSGRPLFFSGYPITPASEILQELSGMQQFGVVTMQVEDEIAACCGAIGASFAGSLGVTATSGPGFALKQEAMGLAVMAELPLVVIDVQRAGPSTGMPTKTEQADLFQALYGRNGESPIPVLAISRPADAFEVTLEASRIALEYMTPVVIMSEGYLGFGSEPWAIPDFSALRPIKTSVVRSAQGGGVFQPYQRDARTLARLWAIPGTPGLEHRIGGLEKLDVVGSISYDPANHQKMVDIRASKIAGIAKTYPETQVEGAQEGDLVVLGWGSSCGAIQAAVREARGRGLSVSHIQLRYINPLPLDLGQKLSQFKRVLMPEGNLGQLSAIIKAAYLRPVEEYHKVQGQPFTVAEVLEKIAGMF
jgi:2-oxoglutarate/2-oxoacid ferredoxin oxidoreductase subunit alpha